MIREMEFSYLVEYPDPELHCSKGDTIWPKIEKVVPQKKVKKHDWIWPLVWLIGLLVLITCLSSCDVAYAGEVGIASCFTRDSCIKEGSLTKMSNGKELNDNDYIIASWRYPLGTKVRVSSCSTAKSVICKVTTRGPGRKNGTSRFYKGVRIADLSKAVFEKLSPSGTTKEGLMKVTVTKIGR